MNLARRIALLNCADVILDLGLGGDFMTQHPFTHAELPERTVKAVEKEMRAIAKRLKKRAGDQPW